MKRGYNITSLFNFVKYSQSYKIVLYKANKHILSFDFFKSAVLVFLLALALFWGHQNQSYKVLFPFVTGVLFAYFPNIEGSHKHRVAGIVLGFAWSFIMLASQMALFDLPQWIHFVVMMIFIFITSMLSVYGLRGTNVSFGGLYAIVSSYGIHAMGLPHDQSLVLVLIGGGVYIALSAISQFFYQRQHIQNMLAECVELTADYFNKLEQQVWEGKDLEEELLGIESKLNLQHEILRSTLLNREGRLFSSNKNRRHYLIFVEMIDLYETTLAANHDLEQASDYFDKLDPIMDPYRKFTRLMIKEVEKLSYDLRLNRRYIVNPDLQKNLVEAENILEDLLKTNYTKDQERILIMRNLIELKNKQLNTLAVIAKHYLNIVFSDKISANTDQRFITTQDYSPKILLSNLNFESSIFRHSIRLCVAIGICFLLQNVIPDENTSWIIATTLVVLRPNYGLTRSRAFDRLGGTIIGAIATLGVVYISDDKVFLFVVAGFCMLIGFSYVATKYLRASIFITLCILLLYVAFTGRSFELLLDRVFYTMVGSAIALFSTYFVFPVWEKESIFTAIRKAINANRRYLIGVNTIYETKEPIDNDFKLLRKEAFVKNGNLYEAFQRLKDDPKSKRSMQSNSYAVVLLSHSTLKAIAAYSMYIQNHQTTSMSEEFKTVMLYIKDQMRVAADLMENIDSQPHLDTPSEALEKLDKYYYNLSQLHQKEIESGVAHMTYEMSVKLQEGKLIIDQMKAIKSLAENTLQMCQLLRSLENQKI